jgi:hypothetical protein
MLSRTFIEPTTLVLFSYVVDTVSKKAADHASFMMIALNIMHFPD